MIQQTVLQHRYTFMPDIHELITDIWTMNTPTVPYCNEIFVDLWRYHVTHFFPVMLTTKHFSIRIWCIIQGSLGYINRFNCPWYYPCTILNFGNTRYFIIGEAESEHIKICLHMIFVCRTSCKSHSVLERPSQSDLGCANSVQSCNTLHHRKVKYFYMPIIITS